MSKTVMPSPRVLIDYGSIELLKRIAKGMEYKVYLTKDRKYVIKVPRIYLRLLALDNYKSVSKNIDKCKSYIKQNKLPILIPHTFIARYKNTYVIIQEYIDGNHNNNLTQKLLKDIKPLPIELNFIDVRVNNILYKNSTPYLIDVSGGFYYRFNNKISKKASILTWHLLQIFKLFYKPFRNIAYEEDKIYINLEFAEFLTNQTRERAYNLRVRILYWHLTKIYKILFNTPNMSGIANSR